MAKRYVFKMKGWTDYFILSISKTRKQMHNDIIKVSNGVGDKCDFVVENAAALVKSMDSLDSNGNLLHSLCFLNVEDLTFNIIVHECVHLAINREAISLRFGLDYSKMDRSDEERLAYYTGEITEAVTVFLKNNGYLDNKAWKAKPTVEWEMCGEVLSQTIKLA